MSGRVGEPGDQSAGIGSGNTRSGERGAGGSQGHHYITGADTQRHRRTHVVAGARADQYRFATGDAELGTHRRTDFADHLGWSGHPRQLRVVAEGEFEDVAAILTACWRPVPGSAGVASIGDGFGGLFGE